MLMESLWARRNDVKVGLREEAHARSNTRTGDRWVAVLHDE